MGAVVVAIFYQILMKFLFENKLNRGFSNFMHVTKFLPHFWTCEFKNDMEMKNFIKILQFL